jgi:hypothetical protein
MKTTLSIIMTIWCLVLINCSKNDSGDKPIDLPNTFTMELYTNYIKDSINIGFSQSSSDKPQVIINQMTLKKLEVINDYWNYATIPYTKIINYDISIAGKSVKGSYEIPDELFSKFFCNGQELIDGVTNYLSFSDSYSFTWNKVGSVSNMVIFEFGLPDSSHISYDTSYVIKSNNTETYISITHNYEDKKDLVKGDFGEGTILTYYYESKHIEIN